MGCVVCGVLRAGSVGGCVSLICGTREGWNDFVMTVSGGLLYGREVRRPSWVGGGCEEGRDSGEAEGEEGVGSEGAGWGWYDGVMKDWMMVYGGVLVVMGVVTFGVYAWDKRRAEVGGWRTPEKTLHLCELCGGWVGGMVARRVLRHKSSKLSFRVVSWGIVGLHVGVVGWLVWWRG